MIRRAPRPDALFLRVRNDVLRDSRLSYKALGLLVFMLSHPDNFNFTRETLAGEGEREGVTAVRTGLAELEATGYLVRSRNRNDDGTFTWTQMVYDTPRTTPSTPTGGLPTSGERLPSSDQWRENDQWATIGGNPSDGSLPLDRTPSIELLLKNDCEEEESPSDSPVRASAPASEPVQTTLVPVVGFEDFYEAYPRKGARKGAERAWRTAIKTADPAAVVRAARRYRDDPNLPSDHQFVPLAQTWLNQGRWDDGPCLPRHIASRPSHDDKIRSLLARADDLADREAEDWMALVPGS